MKIIPVFTYHFHTFQIVAGIGVAYQVLHPNITHLSCSVSFVSGSLHLHTKSEGLTDHCSASLFKLFVVSLQIHSLGHRYNKYLLNISVIYILF